jgi:hypothetical protein
MSNMNETLRQTAEWRRRRRHASFKKRVSRLCSSHSGGPTYAF